MSKFNMQDNWKPDSPCKDCCDRYVGCHSSCVRYISYQQDLDAKRKMNKEGREKINQYEYKEYIIRHHNDRNRKKFKYGD